jgi:hypothetical protein
VADILAYILKELGYNKRYYQMIELSGKRCYAIKGKPKQILYYIKIKCKIAIEKR